MVQIQLGSWWRQPWFCFMTLPGLALFYGGLVRARNVLSVFMHCYAIACLMSLLWFAFGYSIAFGDGNSGYWGGLDKAFLNGIDADTLAGTIPEILFFAFQMTFAIITPALIVGAYVERIGFGFVLLFSSAVDAAVLCACCPLDLGRWFPV